MATEISRDLRREVVERAQGRCEYCHKPDDPRLNPYPHEVDHVIAAKHGGATEIQNLAYACFQCNRFKGTDLTSLDPENGDLTPLFHPRNHTWDENFRLAPSGAIIPLTPVGRTTTRLMRFNDPLRVQQRADLITAAILEPKSTS